MAKYVIVIMVTALMLLTGICEAAKGSSGRIHSFAGPFKVRLNRITVCPTEMLGRNLHTFYGLIKQTRDRANRRLYGYYENRDVVDDSMQLRGTVASWSQTGGWKPNAFILPFDRLCTDLRTVFKDLMENTERFGGGTKFCPRKASNFTITGMPVEFRPKNVPTFPYGKWRADFTYLRKKDILGCTRFYADTVPLLDQGPIRVIGKRVEVCPPELSGKNTHRMTEGIIKQTRDKAYPRIFARWEVLDPFDEAVEAFITFASWSRVSGWAPNAINFRFRKMCSDARAYYHDLVDTLEKYIEVDHKLCPHRNPRNVTINGAPAFFVPNRTLVVAFPYGRWRVDVNFLRERVKTGCVRIIAETVPLVDS